MKRMIVGFLMLTIIGGLVPYGYAKSTERMAVVRVGEVFKVIYKGEGLTRVKVEISDSEGNKVFSEKLLSDQGFIRPYNFSQLPKGDYMICLTDNFGEKAEKICYGELPLNQTREELVVHVVRLNCDENKYLISIPAKTNKEVVINIYNQDQVLVHSEKLKITNDLSKIYYLKNLDGATIKLINENGGEMLFKTQD